jgi:hypothetical protein
MGHLRSLVVVAALAAGAPALAQEPPPGQAPVPAASASTPAASPAPAPEKMYRDLGGHLFLPSHLIENPFSYTAFSMWFGIGSGNALGPQFTSQPPFVDPTANKWYGFTGLGLGMEMNVRILEYLSARALLFTDAYLGTGSGAVFTVGTSARITGDLGVKGSLPIGDKVRLAASVDASYGPVFSILLANGVANALNQCRLDPTQCTFDFGSGLQTSNTLTWNGGLAASWAPLPYLGFTGNFNFIIPTKTGTDSYSQNGVILAAMAEFDARPLLDWLPVGASGAYRLTTPVGGNGVATANEAGFGLYYTGRPHLALGLEIDWQWSTLETQQTSTATLAWINFRYYWN